MAEFFFRCLGVSVGSCSVILFVVFLCVFFCNGVYGSCTMLFCFSERVKLHHVFLFSREHEVALSDYVFQGV